MTKFYAAHIIEEKFSVGHSQTKETIVILDADQAKYAEGHMEITSGALKRRKVRLERVSEARVITVSDLAEIAYVGRVGAVLGVSINMQQVLLQFPDRSVEWFKQSQVAPIFKTIAVCK